MGKVDETAQKNTVLTLYELTESEATLSQGKTVFSGPQTPCSYMLV
jgi:hypothetical protein